MSSLLWLLTANYWFPMLRPRREEPAMRELMFAHITKTKGGYELRICDNPRGVGGFVLGGVKDRMQARILAAAHNAKPWNF